MENTEKKLVKPLVPTKEEWKKFEGAMDKVLRAPRHNQIQKKDNCKQG